MGVEPMERKKMDDLISRKALLEDIKAAAGNDIMGTMVAGTLTRFVKKQPAIDAAPVVYERWEPFGGKYSSRKKCSCCGWDGQEWIKFYNFCPNCGAKMDGGNDND